MYVQVLVEAHAVEQLKLIRFHSGSIIASLTWCLLVPIVVGIMSSVKEAKKGQETSK